MSRKTEMKNVIAFICFFLSGFAGLIYEICWIRKASLVFGSTNYAVSTILAVFFLGLALGSYFFGSIAQRTERPLRLFALMELAVGALALATPFAFEILDILYGMAYRAAHDQFALLLLVRIGLVSLILLPPTILMGGTLPLFCRQYVDSESRIARSVGFLYGLNTLGAAFGCAATGLWLLPSLGMFGAICIGVLLDFTVALATGFLGLRAIHAQASERESRHSGAGNYITVSALVFLIGFVALGNEVLWARHLALLIRNTVYTYALTLTAVLIGIVLGSIAAAICFDRSKSRTFWFGMLQVATGLVTLGLMLIPADFWARFDPLPLSTYFLLLLPSAVLSGAAFPLGVRMVVEDPALAGIGVGRLSAVNTLGGIAGSIVVGFIALPAFGQQSTLLFTTALSLACGFIAWILLDRSSSPRARWITVVTSLVIWVALPNATGTRLPADFLVNVKEGEQLIAYREGLSSNLGIIQTYWGKKVLEINRLWQGEDRKNEQILTAHVPMLLHPDPHTVLMVGLGAGQTASRFLMYKIDRLDCVDIEPAVFDVVRDYFDSSWMNDKRVRLVQEDGRNYVVHTGEHYDVISIEVGQIFRPGVPSFYTSEFYEHAKERLEPGGFLTQLVSIPFFPVEQFRSLVATFLKTFPQSFLWYKGDDMLLIGLNAPQIQLNGNRLAVLQEDNIVSYDLHLSLLAGRSQYGMYQRFVFLGSFIAGPNGLAHLSAGAPIYHDDKPVLDYAVAKWSKMETNEIATIALLRESLDSIAQIITLPIDRAEREQIEQVRKINLDDLVAIAFSRSR